MKQQIKAWWSQRHQREKYLLWLAGGLVVVFALHTGWQEAWRYAEDTRQALTRTQQALRHLPLWEAKLASANVQKAPDAATLANNAHTHGLALSLVQHQTCLRLEQSADVNFSSLLKWLASTREMGGIDINRLEMERKGARVLVTKLEINCHA
ncbi:type II secretion system protein M [Pantoea sp. LS15]|uniref:type II secretion system protein GspM n=1 Tax=Enterobacterales TaxID=91347 RepID=UPI000E0F7BA5|nr:MULTISPECIES: type II secretion system protein GspM [Enterobacterales]NJQ21837.1 type II secretion system protein M [Pantoea sp. LS15]NKF48433.1 type II secretion system protein M [Pantoea sp. LS15]RDK12987.1 hypothetical protein CEJ32_20155 [Enterobacter sp. 9-2]